MALAQSVVDALVKVLTDAGYTAPADLSGVEAVLDSAVTQAAKTADEASAEQAEASEDAGTSGVQTSSDLH